MQLSGMTYIVTQFLNEGQRTEVERVVLRLLVYLSPN
jgi:hypothetical protein